MESTPNTALLRKLPQVEEVLHQKALTCIEGIPRDTIVNAVRKEIDARRQLILKGIEPDVNVEAIAQAAYTRANALTIMSLRRVVNASGVIIHTNLGRSVMAPEAIAAVDEVIAG